MRDYTIITDAAADLSAGLARELGISVIPMSVTLGSETFMHDPDEREKSVQDFYKALRAGEMAVTSAINPEAYVSAFLPELEKGRDVLYLAFSSSLSSSCSSAQMTARELMGSHPGSRVYVCDTLCASMGQGLLALLVGRKAAAGADFDALCEFAEQTKHKICHYFTVNDLMFLKRGGRVSPAVALMGSVLSIKPVLQVDAEGHLTPAGKARGRKAAVRALLEQMRRLAADPINDTAVVSHCDCEAEAAELAAMLKSELGVQNVIISLVGPIIGAHAGPDTLAVFFLGNER